MRKILVNPEKTPYSFFSLIVMNCNLISIKLQLIQLETYWALKYKIVFEALIHSNSFLRWANSRSDAQYAYGIHSKMSFIFLTHIIRYYFVLIKFWSTYLDLSIKLRITRTAQLTSHWHQDNKHINNNNRTNNRFDYW